MNEGIKEGRKGGREEGKEGRKEWKEGRKDFFNFSMYTFYLWLYCVRHMIKDNSDSGILHGLLFLISSKGYFICTIPQRG